VPAAYSFNHRIVEAEASMSPEPPDGLPIHRLLTGKDDAAFCRCVSEAIELGYVLYGSTDIQR
jgi:Domain of unknown function (DUF1737)